MRKQFPDLRPHLFLTEGDAEYYTGCTEEQFQEFQSRVLTSRIIVDQVRKQLRVGGGVPGHDQEFTRAIAALEGRLKPPTSRIADFKTGAESLKTLLDTAVLGNGARFEEHTRLLTADLVEATNTTLRWAGFEDFNIPYALRATTARPEVNREFVAQRERYLKEVPPEGMAIEPDSYRIREPVEQQPAYLARRREAPAEEGGMSL